MSSAEASAPLAGSISLFSSYWCLGQALSHPGPVTFQRGMTSWDKRRLMRWRALSERDRPPFLTVALPSISAASSGSSSYSDALMEWASYLSVLDPEVPPEARFFAASGSSHTKFETG